MVGVESRQVSRRMDITASDKFPAGLRVLAVDDDPTCLMILAQMLKRCNYEVTMCTRATEALSKLREKKDSFDLVISDVYMPDMDGFKLLEQVGLEMDLPVIMTSSHGETSVVMKGVTHGACDYLIKPVRLEELRNIWQHVLRKKKIDASKDAEVSGSAEEIEKHQQKRAGGGGGASDDNEYTSSVNDEGHNWKMTKRRKDDEENDQENEDNSTIKKQRVVWSVELHQQFVGAVNRLGIDKAVPKKILELMGVQGLTRENVASHLQKYRLYLRRLSTVQPPTPAATVPSYGASSEPLFGSTYNGMGPLGQLPHASLLPGGLMNNRPAANMVDTSVLMHSQAPFYGNSKVVPSSLMNIPPRGLDVDGQISPRTDDVSGLVLPQPFANNGILGRANGSGANSFHQQSCFAPRPNNSGANLCTAQGGMNGGYTHRPLVGGVHASPPFYNNVSSGILDNSSNKLNSMTTSFGDLTGGLQHQQQTRGFAPKMPNLGLQSHLQLQQQQQQQQHQPQQQPHESFQHLQTGSQDGFLGGSVLMNGSSGHQLQPTRFAVEAAAANSGTRGSYGGFGLDDSTAESNFPVKVEGGGGGGGLEGGSESVGGANNQDDLFSIFFKQVS